MSRKEVYPVTERVRDYVTECCKGAPLTPAAAELIATLGEYEHGTADIELVFEELLGSPHLRLPEDEDERGRFLLELFAAAVTECALVLQALAES